MRSISIILIILFLMFSQAFSLSKQDQNEYFDKATIQYLVGDFNNAVKNLKIILKESPNYAPAVQLMDSIMREKGINVKKKVNKKSELLKKHIMIARDNFNRGEFSVAITHAKEVLMLDRKNSEAILTISQANDKIKENVLKEKNNIAVGFWVLFAAYVFVSALLSGLAVFLYRKYIPSTVSVKEKASFCWRCSAKLPPNAEICPNCGAQIGFKVWQSVSEEQKLWYGKMGWNKNPFTLDVHPELFRGFKSEIKEILEKISAKSGHILIVGPLGAGKTTLLRWLSALLNNNEHLPIYISRPPQKFEQIIKLITEKMGFSEKQNAEYDIYSLDKLRKKINKSLILLLDEAHEFSPEIERPLRTLGDLDEVNLIMAGLPETIDKLKNEIQPLYERLVLQIELKNLSFEDFKELLKTRIEYAGGKGSHPFTSSALERIYELSHGNPRTILKICDAAVTQAINLGEENIDTKSIRENLMSPATQTA